MSFRHLGKSIIFIFLLGLCFLVACSDTTDPGTEQGDGTGRIDPGTGTFVLKSVESTDPHGRPVRLDLVGSDLELDDDGIHVNLTVALANAANVPVPGPVTLWLSPIDPSSVFVANPDTSLPVGSIIPVDGFIYAEEFGDDHLLEPGETSASKLWRFRTPAQDSFSFGIRAVLPTAPHGPVIAGVCFWDPNRNGVHDPDEPPLVPGQVHVLAPDSSQTVVTVRPDGRYLYPLGVAGLHRVAYRPLFDTFAPLNFSTPNPRHVLITPGPDGVLRGFTEAHFGAYSGAPGEPPPIRFTEEPLDSLHQVFWELVDAEVKDSRILVCDATYGGCQPDHVFSLWTDGAFMESYPVQVNVVLVHETNEDCEAIWNKEYSFDLAPLKIRFLDAYGPGVLIMNLIDFHGNTHPIEWRIFPAD